MLMNGAVNREEKWEKKTVGPKGDILHEERLRRKYGGLKRVDDKDYHRYTARSDAMFFSKKQGDTALGVWGS